MNFSILLLISALSVKGFHEEPQCAAVCPVDCCIDDDDNVETEEELLAKKDWMHG